MPKLRIPNKYRNRILTKSKENSSQQILHKLSTYSDNLSLKDEVENEFNVEDEVICDETSSYEQNFQDLLRNNQVYDKTEESKDTNDLIEDDKIAELNTDLKKLVNKYNLSDFETNDMLIAIRARLAQEESRVSIERRIASLEVAYSHISECIDELVNNVRDIKNHMLNKSKYNVVLPFEDNLEELNDNIVKDSQFAAHLVKFLEPYRPTHISSPNTHGLARILTDELLAQYNWDGSHGKKEFRRLKALNQVLSDAWKAPGDTDSAYRNSIRNQMYAARQRRFQRKRASAANT